MTILFTLRVSFCQKSAAKEYFLYFVFDVWPGFMSNKPIHYLLDYGDHTQAKKLNELQSCATVLPNCKTNKHRLQKYFIW